MSKKYLFLGLLAVMVTGCNKLIRTPIQEPRGHYFLDPQTQFSKVSRVALLEPDNESFRPEVTDLLSQSLADELSKKHLFNLRRIDRSNPLWDNLSLENITADSYEDLAAIQQQLNVDAIIFGTIKRYESFPRMMVGLNLKMIDVRQGRLIWAIEQVWDSTDKQVELRMKRFYKNELRDGYEPLNWEVLNTSPRAFNKFVAYEVAKTLPRLSTAAATAAGRQEFFLLNPETMNPLKIANNY
jgi:hypothetical protein